MTEPDYPTDEHPVPWSLEAEQSVLGGLLIDPMAFDRVAGLVSEASFWSAQHRTIFACIAAMVASNKPVDQLTAYEALKAAGKADDAGGLAYLNALDQSVPSAANIRRYAEIVAEHAAQRALIAAADQALAIARSKAPIAEKMDRISTTFEGLQRQQTGKAPRRLSELLLTAIDRYTGMADGKTSTAWATTIGPLDRILNGGLRPGKLYCLAARPSVGKSSAARAIALGLAEGGHSTLLLSQEMPDDEVADCTVSQLGSINSTRLQTGQFEDEDWARITDASERGADLPFWVDDQGSLTIGDMRAKARMVKGLRVLIVDYLQLSASTLRNATTNDQVAEISKGLKALALSMGIAVVVLSQLNRKVEGRSDKEPQLSDLRDSGAIEQDVDAAVMLWTVKEWDDGAMRLVGWKVPKHRGGPKGRFGMRFDATRYRWSATAESIDPTPAAAGKKGFE